MSKPTAVQFYGLTREGGLYRVKSETPKSIFAASHLEGEGATAWLGDARRFDVRFVLRLSTLQAALEAKRAIIAQREKHADAEQRLAKANAQQLTDLIAKLAAKGG